MTRHVAVREFTRWVFADELRCPQCDREFPRPEAALLKCALTNDEPGLCDALQIEGRRIGDVTSMTARDAVQWLNTLDESLRVTTDGGGGTDGARSNPLHVAAVEPLALLCETGLADLRLDADVGELSIGEKNLLMLATARAAGVVHSLFVVDTPAAGLARDGIDQAATAVRAIQQAGNTVLVVESTPEFLESADWIVELGPGLGNFGGQVVDQGNPAEVLPRMRLRWEDERRKQPGGSRAVDRRPMDHATVTLPAEVSLHTAGSSQEIPLQCLTVLTGGHNCGGEAWLAERFFASLFETLSASNGVEGHSLPCDAVMLVDSGPVSGSRRSTVVTHLRFVGEIRQVFAETRDARVRNFNARDFSFNAASGRCPACRGLGTVRIDMHFLPDMSMPCPECHGSRYRPEILEVRFRGLSIFDVLRLTADEAFPLFRGQRSLQKKIGVLRELGLGALPLGQSMADLTACDVQRLRLAAAVGTGTSERTAFLLIDPSAGLHPLDVDRLLTALDRVLERGHTVLALDRSPQLLAAADCIIRLD